MMRMIGLLAASLAGMLDRRGGVCSLSRGNRVPHLSQRRRGADGCEGPTLRACRAAGYLTILTTIDHEDRPYARQHAATRSPNHARQAERGVACWVSAEGNLPSPHHHKQTAPLFSGAGLSFQPPRVDMATMLLGYYDRGRLIFGAGWERLQRARAQRACRQAGPAPARHFSLCRGPARRRPRRPLGPAKTGRRGGVQV